jgi:hypothetical protein
MRASEPAELSVERYRRTADLLKLPEPIEMSPCLHTFGSGVAG